MTTTINLKRLLDRKQWEMCSFAPGSTTTGSFVCSSNLADQYQFFVNSNTGAFMYDPFEDGWITLPSPALAGTFGAGTCGVRHPQGPRGFPTAGTTTTLTTAINLQRSLAGYKIRIIAGPNAGNEYIILRNTVGTNSVITISTTAGTAFTTASEYILYTGRVWVVNGGTQATGSYKYYDVALNTWSNATITGLPATIGTEGRMVATAGASATPFDTGTSTGSNSTTTIIQTTKTWATNNWTNYQVRITAGVGAGQFRTISSNTATTLTVSVAWTTTPDSSSVYAIEGNDDFIYFMGNNAVTMYRYSIVGNTWTTLAPVAARTGAPGAGMGGNWTNAVTDAAWNDLTGTTPYLNGKYIYSFRGAAGAILDRYDIAGNTWESDIGYAPKSDVIGGGSGYCYTDDYIYVNLVNTGRVLKYNIAKNLMEGFSQLFFAQGTAVTGDRFFDVLYTDGATKIRMLYFMTHSQSTLFRVMVF